MVSYMGDSDKSGDTSGGYGGYGPWEDVAAGGTLGAPEWSVGPTRQRKRHVGCDACVVGLFGKRRSSGFGVTLEPQRVLWLGQQW